MRFTALMIQGLGCRVIYRGLNNLGRGFGAHNTVVIIRNPPKIV